MMMMMTRFFQPSLVNKGAVVSNSSLVKPWLNSKVAGVKEADANNSNPMSRWLLPYADFLTVLFCITLLWCGLALKQAHWLQIQNGKLEQALQQATQQLIVANQTIETQSNTVKNLQKKPLLGKKPQAKESKYLVVPLVSNRVTKPLLLGVSPVKQADKSVVR
jgi:hypothetical protein